MKKTTLSFLLAIITMAGMAQQNITFTFTGVNNTSYTQPDSVKIVNRTQQCDTTMFWPDSVLNFQYVGISQIINSSGGLKVFQNHPNPVKAQTTVSVFVPAKEVINIMVTDIMGRNVIAENYLLEKGINEFSFTPGNSEMYIFTAQNTVSHSSIKILNTKSGHQPALLTYSGLGSSSASLKNQNNIQEFVFVPGDDLLLVAYYDTLESGILDAPAAGKDYVFQFAYNIPCPGMSTVTYGGVVYNTVQIFSQCWLKENMNIGTLIPSGDNMIDNGEIEKYCYDNDQANCDSYGGLYQWDEMMQYENQPGTRGICPEGWHIASNDEWKLLEGATDSFYGIGDTIWNEIYYRGYDAGLNLKSTSGWNNNINGNDLFGFQAVPGGLRMTDGTFNGLFFRGYWGTSNESDDSESWRHYLAFNFDNSGHSTFAKDAGLSVRCVKN